MSDDSHCILWRATLGEVLASNHALVDHVDLAGADDLPLGLRSPKS
ncbi:hypothetical protein EV13_2424 [Prochlorococcus sp. MIT 0702]|nr:hypothetical protein EV13_2424 [Prochlorococcus sp. MIT 0702]